MIFLPSTAITPISAGLLQSFAENAAEWTLIAAAGAIIASPLVLLHLCARRYSIAGMTSGVLKDLHEPPRPRHHQARVGNRGR